MDLEQVRRALEQLRGNVGSGLFQSGRLDDAATVITQLRDDARSLDSSISQLNGILAEIGSAPSCFQQLESSHITSDASLRAARDVGEQMTLMASHVAAMTTQLSLLKIPLDRAAAAALATSAPSGAYGTCHYHQHQHGSGVFPAPAYTEDGQPTSCVRPYRIIYRSGNPEPNDGPAVHRLSRDNHVCILSYFHPWEFSRMRPAIGSTFEIDAANQYTQLTVDCSDEKTQRMWENLPCDVAYRWGQRARNIRQLTSKAMHTGIRAASSNRPAVRRHRHSLPRPSPGPPSHATLEKIRFEEVQYGMSGHSHVDYDERQLPPPSAPVHLPALTTVTRIPAQHAWGRAGRLWVTPNVTTLTFEGWLGAQENEYDGARERIGDCRRLETLEYDTFGHAEDNERLLTAIPEGQGLAGLRSVGRVRIEDNIGIDARWDAAGVDEFRQLLVRRGCVRSLREMTLDVGEYLEDTAEMRQLIENAVKLIDAAMHPDARSQPIMPCIRSGNREDGQIDLQLLAWSHRHRSPMVQKLVNDFAKGVRNVVFNERPRPSHANPVTPATFPHATTLILPIRFPRHKQVDRAVEVAVNMPRLERVECGGSCSAFLKALHAAAPEKKLRSVALNLTAERLVISNWDREWDEAETRTSLPEIELMELGLEGELVGDSQLDELHGKVLTLLLAFSKLKVRSERGQAEPPRLQIARAVYKFKHRFASQHILSGLSSTEYRLEWVEVGKRPCNTSLQLELRRLQ
ncbi:unnamed protein product [Vitrella brassicaformis CCMP3155]|uniref:Uncharacterized protein n=1 Tax=Vitrella brassicaformis (strain CCMP3155) TaxID=1169540 RepID=A0A0G4ES89_VITBC|nr:unnamed protein product [Vitrella brassicaformis CCMP3155]|eukprot:CEM00536.1 unnamed protein product [Vitrella brassicaformis CCMP3155]